MKILLSPLLLFSLPVFAQNSLELNHTVTVERMCTISTVQHMVFPTVTLNSVNTQSTAQGIVQILCTKGSYYVNVSGGNNGTVTYTKDTLNNNPLNQLHYFSCNRAMKNGAHSLPYDILVGEGNDAGYPNTGDTLSIGFYTFGPPTLSTAVYNESAAAACNNPIAYHSNLQFKDNVPQNLIIRGRMTPPKGVRTGVYSDNISVIVRF